MSKKFTSIGGQALIEGVMMRGENEVAIAVRKSDGEIVLKEEKAKGHFKRISKIPFLRGMFMLISSMLVGIKALTYSAEFFEEEEVEKKSKFDLWIEKVFKDKADDVIIGFSIVSALVMAVVFFTILPAYVIGALRSFGLHSVLLSGLEGVIKILFFVIYILAIRRMNEIKRVFQYHGAEHKSIHCYESKLPLTVENARKFTTLHPRCGTSFLVFVLLISILVFSFLSWEVLWLRVGMKILLLPVIAGISYEVIRLAGKSDHPIVKLISIPGLQMQKLTTLEPDDDQLEVALAALRNVVDKVGDLE